jgi:4-hydroxybenzoyl-CoA reductase subunit beta
VEGLYRNDGQYYLAKTADEILVSIHFPDRSGWSMAYWKLRRRGSIDFPILGVAVALKLEDDGVCSSARVVLGAVSSQPVVVDEESTGLLIGRQITPEIVQAFTDRAYRLAKPMDNADMALGYRKKLSRVYIAGAVSEAAGLKVD